MVITIIVVMVTEEEECLIGNLLEGAERGRLPAVLLTELPAVTIVRPALVAVEEGRLDVGEVAAACRG